MLLGNYSVLNKNPGRAFGGSTVSGTRSQSGKSGAVRGKFYGQFDLGFPEWMSIPSGARPPYSWQIAQKAGSLSSFNSLSGSGTKVGSIAGGKNGEATLAGSGDFGGAGSLIVSAVATLIGSGTLSASVTGTLNAAATLAGAGDIAGALGALAGAVATLTGTGTISDASETAKGHMSADIYVNSGTASTRELAAEVWNSLAAEFDTSGTMGEKLNAAGTAGDPWTTDLTGYNTADTAGKIVKDTLKKAKGAYLNTI